MAELEHISSVLPRLPVMKDLKKWVLENMEIVVDTREKENTHVLFGIEQLGGRYSVETLKTGDYACRLCGELRNDVIFERKNSLTELASNITTHRERFERELQRAAAAHSKIILLIEDDFNNLFEAKYRSRVSEQAFLASLFTYQARYGIEIASVRPGFVGKYIFNRFYYNVRELIRSPLSELEQTEL